MIKKHDMEDTSRLPEDYVPFKTLHVCGNRFVSGSFIVKVGQRIPILIGKGVVPLVWIAIAAKGEKEWTFIVARNTSVNPELSILFSKNDHSTTIKLKNSVIIKVRKLNEDETEIVTMDLRPIGLKIYGDENGLHIGTHFLAGSTFEGAETMFAIGD